MLGSGHEQSMPGVKGVSFWVSEHRVQQHSAAPLMSVATGVAQHQCLSTLGMWSALRTGVCQYRPPVFLNTTRCLYTHPPR